MDIALQLMTSYVSIIVTEHQVIISQYQKQIQDIVGDKEMQERTPAIGFMANFDDDFDDD